MCCPEGDASCSRGFNHRFTDSLPNSSLVGRRFRPQVGLNECEIQYLLPFRRVSGAQSSVDICVFTITDDRISNAIQAAHQRGVRTRIVTDDEKAFDRGSDIQRLEKAGLDIRVDRSAYHMHHKFAIFDGRLLVTGSYNWTRSADEYNEENYVISGDQRLIHRYLEMFEKLWEKFA